MPQLAEQMLESRPYPEHAYRACLGLMSLARCYGDERVGAASKRALPTTSHSSVKSILAEGLDKVPVDPKEQLPRPPEHENLRSAGCYYAEEADARPPAIAKLEALGLSVMADGLADQLATPGTYDELACSDRLGLLVDREADARDSRRLARRLKEAKLRYPTSVEDVDFGSARSRPLGRARTRRGSLCRGAPECRRTGATGCGKSFLACALANAALRQGPHGALRPHPETLGGSLARPCRRALRASARRPRPSRALGPRRLPDHPGRPGGLP